MIPKFKKVRILSLKFLVVASLSLEYKEVLQSPRWCTHQVLNHSKRTKNEEDMRLELGTGLEQLSFILFLVFCCIASLPLILKEHL
jgi:hypothetical protein